MTSIVPVDTKPASWATPDAELVLAANAPREVWLAERARGIGGSDAAAVAGFTTRWTSPRKIYWDKRGLLKPDPDNHFMLCGRLFEAPIAELFEILTGIKTQKRGLLRSKKWPWMQASVDRLTADGGGLEIKNTGYHRAKDWGDDDNPLIPDAAEIQAMHCMAVTGKQFWWVMAVINGNTPVIRKVVRNEKTIEALVEIERKFWFDNVLAGVAPPVDGSESCTEVLKSFYPAVGTEPAVVDREILEPLAQRKEAARLAVKAAEEALELVNNEIRDLAGTATALCMPGNDGQLSEPVFTYVANGQFSKKRFMAEEPAELVKTYTREVTKVELDVDGLKKDHGDLVAKHRARVLRMGSAGKKLIAQSTTTTSTTKVA